MQSPTSRVREKEQPEPEHEGVELLSVTVDKRNEAEQKAEKWAQKERRESLNRARHEAAKQRQRIRGKQVSQAVDPDRQEAIRKFRRLKYKEQMKKREADDNERAKLLQERAQKAEQAAVRRRLERRRTLPSRLLSLSHREAGEHELKIESLLRGEPLFSLENAATKEPMVQFSVDHLARLQPGRWLNQEIIDWYICVVTSRDTAACLFLGAEFLRQLMMKNQGPAFVVDFHRPVALRGVVGGERYCALEGARLILAPANPNANHWVLIAIFPDQRKISCCDSLSPGPKGSVECRKIARGVMEWVALHEKRRMGTMEGWVTEMVQSLPRQRNTWDCGVHVCDFARMLTVGPHEGASCNDEKATNAFRARLLVYALETALIAF